MARSTGLKALSGLRLLASQDACTSRAFSQLALTNTGLSVGPGGRSSVSGITATVFGASGFLGRYVVNALAKMGSQMVIPYRSDDTDLQHVRQMGDLGQMVMLGNFNVRDEDQIRHAISKSNIVVNLIGADKETWNYGFEEVHVDIAGKIASIAAEHPGVERYIHFSCLGAAPDAASRRLRTKAAGEAAVREAFPGATIFKPAVCTGIEDKLFNAYAKFAKIMPFVPLLDGGHTKLQPVFVRDVTQAMANSLKTFDAVGKTYHLAGPDVLTIKEMVELTFDIIREQPNAYAVPSALMRAAAMPREWLVKKLPIPINHMFTVDYIDEISKADYLLDPLPAGVLTFADLDVAPQRVTEGIPIEHIRHYRSGGYDFGTTAGTQATGGAGGFSSPTQNM